MAVTTYDGYTTGKKKKKNELDEWAFMDPRVRQRMERAATPEIEVKPPQNKEKKSSWSDNVKPTPSAKETPKQNIDIYKEEEKEDMEEWTKQFFKNYINGDDYGLLNGFKKEEKKEKQDNGFIKRPEDIPNNNWGLDKGMVKSVPKSDTSKIKTYTAEQLQRETKPDYKYGKSSSGLNGYSNGYGVTNTVLKPQNSTQYLKTNGNRQGRNYNDSKAELFTAYYESLGRENKKKSQENVKQYGSIRDRDEKDPWIDVFKNIATNLREIQSQPGHGKAMEQAMAPKRIQDGADHNPWFDNLLKESAEKILTNLQKPQTDPRITQATANQRVWQRATSYDDEDFINDYHSMTKYPLPQVVDYENRDGWIMKPSRFEQEFYKNFEEKHREINAEIEKMEKELRNIESNQRHSLGLNGEKMDDTYLRKRLASYKAIQSNMRTYEKIRDEVFRDDYIRLSKMSSDDILKSGNTELKEMFPHLTKPMTLPEWLGIMQKGFGTVLEISKRSNVIVDDEEGKMICSYNYDDVNGKTASGAVDIVKYVDENGNKGYRLKVDLPEATTKAGRLLNNMLESFNGIKISEKTLSRIADFSTTAGKYIPANNIFGYGIDLVSTGFIMQEDYEADGELGEESGKAIIEMFFGWAGAAAGTLIPFVGPTLGALGGEYLMRMLADHIYEQTKDWETSNADFSQYHERAK